MANEYRTVYQGSARGSRGVGKTRGPQVSQEIVKKGQAIASEAGKVEQDYSRVIKQQAAEMIRQDKQATLNETKELNDLKAFNKSMNDFFMTSAKTVGKDYVAEKRQQGVDLARKAAAGDPDAIAKLELDKKQLNEIEERIKAQEEKINRALTDVEEGNLRTSLEEKMKAQNIRRLGTNVRFGYIRGTLVEASKGYNSHLETTLATSEEYIPGTDILIGNYYNETDPKRRKAIIDYVEDQYIANNNPYGADQKAVRTYLTKSVVEQTDKFQELEVERFKRDAAEANLEDLTNNISISFENFEENPEGAVQSIERLFTNGRRIMINRGVKGNPGAAVKEHILKEIPEALSRIKDPNVREAIIKKLSETKFTIQGQGSKTLQEHWGVNEWNPDDIAAKADIVQANRIAQHQTARTVLLKDDIAQLKVQVEDNKISETDYKKAVGKLFDTYGDVFDVGKVLDEALKYDKRKMTREISETYVNELLKTNDKITEAEALFLDPDYREELRKKGLIVDHRFGDGDKLSRAAKETGTKNITAVVLTAYNEEVSGTAGYDKNDILTGNSSRVVKSLSREMMTTAELFFNAGEYQDASGVTHKITTKSEAFKAAEQVVIAKFRAERDLPTSKYYLTPEGFTEIGGPVGDTDKTKEALRNNFQKLEEFKINSEKSSSDLLAIGDFSWVSDTDLEPINRGDGSYRLSNTVLTLANIDALHGSGERDAYHVLNLLRTKRGLEPIKFDESQLPKETLDFREARNQTPQSIQRKISESIALNDGKSNELAIDEMGLVNVGRMNIAATGETPYFSLGSNYENLPALLSQANMPSMTLAEFQGNEVAQLKLNRFITNDLMMKAEKLTNDKNEMIRLTAVGLRFGEEAMGTYKTNKEQVEYASNAFTRYISGANIEDTGNVAAVSEEDIVITKVDAVQVDTSGYGTLTTIKPSWSEKAILTVEQRNIFEEPIATDLAGARAQLAKINNAEPPAGSLRGNKNIESQAAINWEARKERLRNQVQALEILSHYSPSTISTLGGISGKERLQLFHPRYGLITKILGTERLNELKNEAYANSGNAPALSNEYEEALMNLIRSQPEFGAMEMF